MVKSLSIYSMVKKSANCVCEFHGCYYHGCPAHYESSAPTPHQVGKTMYQKGDTVYERLKFGNLLSNTITRIENIKEAAFNVVEKWECKWDNICKEFLLPISKNELEHIKYLSPRDMLISVLEQTQSNCITDATKLKLFTI